jgi:hypothetical protein
MPRYQLSNEDKEAIFQLAKQWGRIVARRAFGDDGPGLDVDLDTMEEVAVAAARGLTAGTLEQATQQQAQRLGEQQRCPGCGRLCAVQAENRLVHVRGGTFDHHEPVCHCPTCRRDFFPSASAPEDR